MDKNDKINVTEKVIDFNSINKTNNTTLSDEAIDQIVKAASDATPQEVINMHNSMNHAEEMSEEDFEPELRNINLDTPYEDLVQGTKNNYNISDKDLFELAKDGSTISDEDIADKLKETTEGMNLSDEESVAFLSLVSKYRANSNMSGNEIYKTMPETMKEMVRELAVQAGAQPNEYGNVAKFLLDQFLSSAELDQIFVDFQKSLDEALDIPSMTDLYSEHTKEVMTVKLPEIIEKYKDEEPEKAALLQRVKDAFDDAYSLKRLKEHYESNSRTRKLMRRDIKKYMSFCEEANLKNERTEFMLPDARGIPGALSKVLIEDVPVDPEDRINKLKITDIDVDKLTILICRSLDGLYASNTVDAAYIYYLLKNITMLNLVNENRTPFALELINNICDVIEFVREKEAEFNASKK